MADNVNIRWGYVHQHKKKTQISNVFSPRKLKITHFWSTARVPEIYLSIFNVF